MVWEFFPDNVHPRWHDHSLKKRTLKPIELISRKQWGAFPAMYHDLVDHPVFNVRVVETHGDKCLSHDSCYRILQSMQFDHMRCNMPDINYNFLIGGNGSVYEGRGWYVDCQMAPKFDKIDQDCLTIAFIGSFDKTGTDIPEIMRKALKRLINNGIKKKYIDCCYRHIPFRNFED